MNKFFVAFLFLIICILSCAIGKKVNHSIAPFTKPIEEAHQWDRFMGKKFFSYDVELTWRGKKEPPVTIITATNSSLIKIVNADGTSALYENGKMSYNGKMDSTGARFDIFTWSYFMMLPYKLNDPGTNWKDFPNIEIDNGKKHTVGKLTFGSNIGDAPDDWYIVFKDNNTNLIDAAAYIVTAGGTPQEKAALKPSMIHYLNYTLVDGIPICDQWKFTKWLQSSGIGEEVGSASIKNIKFLNSLN
jgi:hypothetical protein